MTASDGAVRDALEAIRLNSAVRRTAPRWRGLTRRKRAEHCLFIASQIAAFVESGTKGRLREEAQKAQAAAVAVLPFSGQTPAACVKCSRAEGTRDRFHEATPTLPEHLMRSCRSCGFDWREQCADAPLPEEPQEDAPEEEPLDE